MNRPRQQASDCVFMVRPASFAYNAETAASNAFQVAPEAVATDVNRQARLEFDRFVRQLRAEGVQVLVVEDDPAIERPDAVFPNNWVSFHDDGTLVLYPMYAANRRLERRPEVLDDLIERSGFRVRRRLDLTPFEARGQFLEGTGSLVLDHVRRVAYAVPSLRTDAALVRHWCDAMGFDAEIFPALDAAGQPYYHTNVVLSIGTRFAVLAAEAIPATDRDRVLTRLADSGREVVPISRAQVLEFCGNVLELATWDEALGDSSVLAMSRRARAAFTPLQFSHLESCVDAIVAAPLDLIERLGGGGARCMLAEIFRSP